MRRIGRYDVLEELGRDGLATRYKARNPETSQIVVLQALSPLVTVDPKEKARLWSMAEVMLQVTHPNVVQTLEVFEDQGQVFVATEYVEGRTLAEIVTSDPITPEKATTLVETLARALDTVHKQGVLHRDLKPRNIVVTADGTPRLTDFLPPTPQEQSLASSGFMVGTLAYMAPEQFRDSSRVSPATDVYGLGAVLYTALTGQPPVQGQSPSQMMMHVVSSSPPLPSRVNPKVPPDLEAICLKCLSKDPKERFASAADLAQALRQYRGGLESPQSKPEPKPMPPQSKMEAEQTRTPVEPSPSPHPKEGFLASLLRWLGWR